MIHRFLCEKRQTSPFPHEAWWWGNFKHHHVRTALRGNKYPKPTKPKTAISSSCSSSFKSRSPPRSKTIWSIKFQNKLWSNMHLPRRFGAKSINQNRLPVQHFSPFAVMEDNLACLIYRICGEGGLCINRRMVCKCMMLQLSIFLSRISPLSLPITLFFVCCCAVVVPLTLKRRYHFTNKKCKKVTEKSIMGVQHLCVDREQVITTSHTQQQDSHLPQ